MFSIAPDTYGALIADCRNDIGSGHACTFVAKDNIEVEGQPSSAGLPLFSARVERLDADIVRRLKTSGTKFAGMAAPDSAGLGTTTPEVSNPSAPGISAVGLSGGSAAAVAGGLADLALGTDTGGSVRVPAACCGAYGFKCSNDRFSMDGIWPLSKQFDAAGVLAASLEQVIHGAAALLDGDVTDETVEESLRVGVVENGGEIDERIGSQNHPATTTMVRETCLGNIAGLPVLAFPSRGVNPAQPMGLQLAGTAGRDERLLAVALSIVPILAH